MENPVEWRPSASVAAVRARARLYAAIRGFFQARGVLEVDTPVLSAAATVDRHIESFAVAGERWLQTSPEFAMKRLLAAGCGPIFQIAHAFRLEESGRHHNPEFVLLEWYRPDMGMAGLMDEVQALLCRLGAGTESAWPRLSYRDAFGLHAAVDPFAAGLAELRRRCREFAPAGAPPSAELARDFYLDLLMSHVVGPQLGLATPVFLFDFPASQAALAQVRPGDPPVAERFELFWKGLELANGFHELGDAAEQQRRFEQERSARAAAGQPVPPYDAHLVAALQAGLPDCSGVAVGLDRLLMLLLELPRLEQVLAFGWGRA
jgi:lysyl-tRNA synthetase class 2